MRSGRMGVSFGLALILAAFAPDGEAAALIVGRTAEAEAEKHERQGDFKQAAVWRLFAARAFRELIIPFEIESVRGYAQAGENHLAKICAERAMVRYPPNVRTNRRLYEQDLQKAGGEAMRAEVEQEAAELLAKVAPIPLAVPSRLRDVEEEEGKGNWRAAADCRELSARIFLHITVPFFERESDAAKDEEGQIRWRREALKYLRLAQENFTLAAQHYERAGRASAAKSDAASRNFTAFCQRKVPEMREEAKAVGLLIAARS